MKFSIKVILLLLCLASIVTAENLTSLKTKNVIEDPKIFVAYIMTKPTLCSTYLYLEHFELFRRTGCCEAIKQGFNEMVIAEQLCTGSYLCEYVPTCPRPKPGRLGNVTTSSSASA